MRKEEVYIITSDLNEDDKKQLLEITGLPFFNSYLHYHEGQERWITFGYINDDFRKEHIQVFELIDILKDEMVEPIEQYPSNILDGFDTQEETTITKKGSWFNRVKNYFKNNPIVVDLDYLFGLLIIYLAFSRIVSSYNPLEWNGNSIGVFFILIVFYEALNNLKSK